MTWRLFGQLVLGWFVLVGAGCVLILAAACALSRVREDFTIRRHHRVLLAELDAVLKEAAR